MADTLDRYRDALAKAYDDLSRARIIAGGAGIPAYAQPIEQPDMLTWWWQTLNVAWRRGVLVALLDVAVADPAVVSFRPDFEALRELVEQLQAQPAPSEGNAARAAPPAGAVLLDEGHGQGDWNGSKPTLLSGYREAAKIAAALTGTGAERHRGLLSGDMLAGRRVLILPIGPQGQTHLSGDEITALDNFIGDGGGLLVLSTYCGDAHHHANLNDLLKQYGILCNADVVMPAEMTDPQLLTATHTDQGPAYEYVIEAVPDDVDDGEPVAAIRAKLLSGVTSVLALAPCSLSVQPFLAGGVLRSKDGSWLYTPDPFEVQGYLTRYPRKEQRTASILAASTNGKVVVAGSWRMFGDKFMAGDNRQLFHNILSWLVARE